MNPTNTQNQTTVPQSTPPMMQNPGIPTLNTQVPQSQQNSTSKALVILVVLLLILFLGMLGYLGYSYWNNMQQASKPVIPPTVNTKAETVTPTVEPLQTSEDVSALDIGSVEGDLKDINSDLQGL